MASSRAYRGALPLETVRSEIEKNSGLMYDPDVAKAMLDIGRSSRILIGDYNKLLFRGGTMFVRENYNLAV